MKITLRHHGWPAGALAATGLAIALALAAPPARSDPGLLLGGAAAVLVAITASRGLRRRLIAVRIGSAAGWLRAHLWLGLLSLVFALAHSGFRLGGGLSTALTLVLTAAVLSGVLGVALQRVLTREINALSTDTIFDLQRGVLSLRRRAYEIVWGACGAAPDAPGEADELRRLGAPPRTPGIVHPTGTLAGQAELDHFYRDLVLPFLHAAGGGSSLLATAADATLAFDALEAHLAAPLRPALAELRDRCGRLRAARRQHRLYRWLHGWLLLHVPLSMALLVLLITHAVMALRY
jgi:hypothetical protein